jgi:radical SAM superfamily enzyme YgiQ (UPF0313 family)
MAAHARVDERARSQARLRQEQSTLEARENVPVCLAYPSPYTVGMSSLGFLTLHRLLNLEGPGAHRAFLPDEWHKMSLPWPQPRRPIHAYESTRLMSEHRIVGISVAYELEVVGVIRLLEGAGIPVLASDRGPRDPVIVAGGPLTLCDPSALLPFVDLLVMGEAEEELPRAVGCILAARTREAGIEAAASLPHTASGELARGQASPLPSLGCAPAERLPGHAAITTPEAELSDMFLVELTRGCSRPCTFCVMGGSRAGKTRFFDVEHVLSAIPEDARRVGLVGAAVTDHPDVEQVAARVVASGRDIGLSSLRADRLTPALLESLRAGGYRTITVASDGVSERMRQELRRGIREETLLNAARMVRDHGFHRLKVYEMIGAPGETDDDIEELVRFAAELSRVVRLCLTFSTFVPKRGTPAQALPFIGVREAEARLRRIREGLGRNVELRPQSPRWAHIEHELAQGGIEAGHAALAATRAGGSYRDFVRALQTPAS